MECEDCGVTRWKLHRHHIIPKSQGGSDDPSNVVRICANCHEDRHGGPRTDSIPWQLSQTPQANEKRREAMKRQWAAPGYRERVGVARALAQTPEVQARRSASMSRVMKGRVFTEAHRAALSAAHMGKTLTPEAREKMSQALKGRVFTDEHRAHLSAAQRARNIKPPAYDGTIEPIIKVCPWDGARFEVGGRGRPKTSAVYCSRRCSAAAREAARRDVTA